MSAEDYLQIATALEAHSEHPIAKSFVHACPHRTKQATDVTSTPGHGMSGTVDNVQWLLGKPDFISSQCSDKLPESLEHAEHTRVLLASNDQVHAAFILEDEIRDDAAELIAQLKRDGKAITLLTGDNAASARHVARQTGIDNVHANLKPEDKLEHIKALQQQGDIVCMTGDGVNDAPVLAGADVSIAMGSGAQLAAASADIIMLSSSISTIYKGYRLSIKTLAIIRQNLTWALGYNILAVPAAAMGYILPWMAAIGMSASSLVVVLNALRLSAGKSKK
jgi:Cu2+-exporting ATPase